MRVCVWCAAKKENHLRASDQGPRARQVGTSNGKIPLYTQSHWLHTLFRPSSCLSGFVSHWSTGSQQAAAFVPLCTQGLHSWYLAQIWMLASPFHNPLWRFREMKNIGSSKPKGLSEHQEANSLDGTGETKSREQTVRMTKKQPNRWVTLLLFCSALALCWTLWSRHTVHESRSLHMEHTV